MKGIAAVAAVGLAVAGCGSSGTTSAHTASGSGSGSSAISGSPIARAADVSASSAGEKVAYTLSLATAATGSISVTGTGSFNRSPYEGEMDLNIAAPNASGELGSILSGLQLQIVIDKGQVDIKLPSSLGAMASTLTGGRPWLSVTIAKIAGAAGIPGLSSLAQGGADPADPAAQLKELESASGSSFTKVGAATVNGIATTEYQGTLDLAKVTKDLPSGGSPATKALLKELASTAEHFTIYVDSANLIRRVVLSVALPAGTGASSPLTMQMNFLDYGQQPAPAVPPASETYNLDKLLSGGLSSLLGGGLG